MADRHGRAAGAREVEQAAELLADRLGIRIAVEEDVALGGRQAFLASGPFSRGWRFPNFTATYTIMNNDLQAVINGSMTTSEMLAHVAASLKG